MERKNLLIGVGISAVAAALIGIYFYYNRDVTVSEEEKEIVQEEVKVETKAEIITQLNEELKDKTKPVKENYVYNADFIATLYYLLAKYATKMNKLISDAHFDKKIELLENNDHLGYAKEFIESEQEEAFAIQKVSAIILNHFKLMDQEYIISLNYHSQSEEFRKRLIEIQTQVSIEVYGANYFNEIPESLTKEKTIEIRDFARSETTRIITELSNKISDPMLLQKQANFEIAKLDDVAYIKFGYKSKEVLKAFEKYNLLEEIKKQTQEGDMLVSQVSS